MKRNLDITMVVNGPGNYSIDTPEPDKSSYVSVEIGLIMNRDEARRVRDELDRQLNTPEEAPEIAVSGYCSLVGYLPHTWTRKFRDRVEIGNWRDGTPSDPTGGILGDVELYRSLWVKP